MSALFSANCGRAFGSFGMRTFSGRRPSDASAGAGMPVSGQNFGFGVGVGVGGGVAVAAFVGTGVAVGDSTATGAPPPPHAAAMTAIVRRRVVTRSGFVGITLKKPIRKQHAKRAGARPGERGRSRKPRRPAASQPGRTPDRRSPADTPG